MGSPETTITSSIFFLKPLITIDASVSLFLHTLFKPILPIFLLLLLEYSADFQLSFHVSLSLFPTSPSFSSLSIPFILGHLLDLALIGLIKLTFHRTRPHYNPNMSPVVHADNFSFPSGHASRVIVWVWAILTAISRVLLGRHFLSDVLAGAFVGVLEGIVACRFLRF
ncbi:hypothetical protein Gohar_005573 [Gossypium harknessii]|uniref:Phosphatidic acid phosphatase type 2/haloperoxidase domain-containing protein n=1 Tax=Gossypium harknessii TaxID=34285 RepID=A0A7J9H8K1_9ROSI|nr:hypothetical protein [Gossypium harknessii]